MRHLGGLALTSIGMMALPAAAQVAATASSEERLRSAIAQAESARAAAADALRRADEAIAILNSALLERVPAPANPTSATVYRAVETRREAVPRPGDMPACDAAGGVHESIGDYVFPPEAPDGQKKESSYDAGEPGTNMGINAFVYHCLGMTRATDYENTTNLSAQFTGTKGNDQIEAAVTRTARGLVRAIKDGKPAMAATYIKGALGGFGRTGSDGDAPLIDLTESNFASGIGFSLGLEYGRMPAVETAAMRKSLQSGVAKARRDCVAENAIVDPLASPGAGSDGHPRYALDPMAACEGDALVKWMADHDRANKYWTDVVAPLWNYKGTPERFIGAQLRYAFQELGYRPVIDPATGAVVVTNLPDKIEIHPETYSLKLYGGFNRPIISNGKKEGSIGVTTSVTYRREVDFIAGTSGKTVCTPAVTGALFDICNGDQKLAAPYDTRGVVGGIALNLQSRRFWYMPPLAVSPRLTYAFDTKRLGIEIPFFLLTDADGKLNSGFKYTCRFRGETSTGLELKKSCGLNLFVGTSFEIGKTP